MSDLAVARHSIATVSKGKAVNEDAWMSMWCSMNWGDLLQPAPLSIALLGSILILASSTDDFSLVQETPPGCPAFEWKYARHPDSFKTCLQQMVGNGYTAYETAHKNMETINNLAGQIPEVIRDLVELILKGKMSDLQADFFQNGVADLIKLSDRCAAAAQETEEAFDNLTGLAQEMVLACTYKAGTAEQALAQNEIILAVLEAKKVRQETMVNEAKERTDMMKKSYADAENAFHEAVHDFPDGWELLGLQFVESMVGLVVTVGNVFTLPFQLISGATGGKDSNGGIEATNSPAGVSTQANKAALYDPGVKVVQRVLDQVNNIKALLTGAAGKPDWDKIRSKSAKAKTGATYVQKSLQTYKSELELDKPVSLQLNPLIDQAIDIVTVVIKAGNDVAQADNENALSEQVPLTNGLIARLNALVAAVNLLVHQPGSVATGPATPPTPSSSSASRNAVENAKFKVDQTRSQLEATRDAYQMASDRLCAQQQAITNTIGEVTQLKLTNDSLRQLLPVLKKAVGAFTTLRSQLSTLVQFFQSVTSLLKDVMAPSVDRWVSTITSAEKQLAEGVEPDIVGGVTVSDFTRDLIYRQMMVPLKVSTLAVQISTVYMDISHSYIMPAQRSVGLMLQFNTDPSGDVTMFKAKLAQAQEALAKQTKTASEQISAKVAKDQKLFVSRINNRLDAIVEATRVSMPEVTQPVPNVLRDVARSHATSFDQMKAKQAAENPLFDPDDAM